MGAGHTRHRPDFGVRQGAFSKRGRNHRPCLEYMRHADLLTRGIHTQVATIMQPLGTVYEAPLQPAGAFVELANQHQQFVGLGIDASCKIDDGTIEFVDGQQAVLGRNDRLHDTSLWSEWVPVIVYRNGQKSNIKSMS